MIQMYKTIIVVIGFIAAVSASAAELSETSVRAFMSTIDEAVNMKDAEKIDGLLAENVQIALNMTANGQTQVMSPSKQEYLAMLNQGWAMSSDYSYTRSIVNIDIQSGKASVSSKVKESMTVQGQSLSGESREELVIEVVDGNFAITRIVGHTNL
jgi:hypothetical protein